MSLPILYSFRRCPYAMRARMALDAACIPVEHREVRLRDKPDEMLTASPKGTVPVLVMPDDEVLDESLDIMLWALAQSDPDGWLAKVDQDRSDTEAFLAGFKDQLDRYKYARRYDPFVERGVVDLDRRADAMSLLMQLSAPLQDTPYLRGTKPRLIDMATFPFIRQFAAVESDWWHETASKPLQQWLRDLLESKRFQRIMTKHPVWQSEQKS